MSLKNRTKNLISILSILILIPITIAIGMYLMDDRRYYFISTMIIAECLIPFILSFESTKKQSRELIIISVLSALCVVGRIAFAAVPHFKPFVALIIISAVCFGSKTGVLVGALSAFVSNFYFTQGPWTPWQMFAAAMVGFIAGLVFKNNNIAKNKYISAAIGFILTAFVYGTITNVSSFIMFQENLTFKMLISTISLGISADLIHGTATAIFIFLFLNPIRIILKRVKRKYGIEP